jgi:hypothetical protein
MRSGSALRNRKGIPRPKGRTPIQRFWEKVNKHTLSGCWEWTGSRNDYGYGQMKWDSVKVIYAHRFSYELHIGPIPTGLVLMHSCDKPSCVNPDHLTPGTNSDNTKDMILKGRCRTAKITIEQVREIKRRLAGGEYYRDMAKEFNVSVTTVYFIKTGKTWANVA